MSSGCSRPTHFRIVRRAGFVRGCIAIRSRRAPNAKPPGDGGTASSWATTFPPCRCADLELHPFRRAQALQDRPVTGRDAEPADARVRDDETIERIARPGFFSGLLEPFDGGRIVKLPVLAVDDGTDAGAEPQAAELVEHLQLEGRGGRDE